MKKLSVWIEEVNVIERTVCLIKPGTARNSEQKRGIIQMLIDAGFKIRYMKKYEFNERMASKFYKEHKGRDYYKNLIKYTCSDYQVAILLEGFDVINKYREISKEDAERIENVPASAANPNAPFGASGPVVAPGSSPNGPVPDADLIRQIRIERTFGDLEEQFNDLENKDYDIEWKF